MLIKVMLNNYSSKINALMHFKTELFKLAPKKRSKKKILLLRNITLTLNRLSDFQRHSRARPWACYSEPFKKRNPA